jgi:tetratricopeptide (TPR) repeat protein
MIERTWVPCVLVLFLSACGGGGAEPRVPTAGELTEEGWARYAAGRNPEAAASFTEAVAVDPDFADAYNGRGWANLRRTRFPEALADFSAAIDRGLAAPDPAAGRALALRDLEPVDWTATAEAAVAVLAEDAAYVFSRDPSLDWRDLRVLLGQARFAVRDYTGANQQIAILGGTPADPGSATFVRDVLAELERLAAEP